MHSVQAQGNQFACAKKQPWAVKKLRPPVGWWWGGGEGDADGGLRPPAAWGAWGVMARGQWQGCAQAGSAWGSAYALLFWPMACTAVPAVPQSRSPRGGGERVRGRAGAWEIGRGSTSVSQSPRPLPQGWVGGVGARGQPLLPVQRVVECSKPSKAGGSVPQRRHPHLSA